MGTLYYAEVFTLVPIQIQIPARIFSKIFTVPILGWDVRPKDRCPSQFYYISIRASQSESEPMGNFCIVQQSQSESESESESGNVNKHKEGVDVKLGSGWRYGQGVGLFFSLEKKVSDFFFVPYNIVLKCPMIY